MSWCNCPLPPIPIGNLLLSLWPMTTQKYVFLMYHLYSSALVIVDQMDRPLARGVEGGGHPSFFSQSPKKSTSYFVIWASELKPVSWVFISQEKVFYEAKNVAPNGSNWVTIFKKFPTSERGTSPQTPPASSATHRASARYDHSVFSECTPPP